MPVCCSGFTRRGGLVRPASKSFRFSHHPLRVPKGWHGDFAACGQRSGLLALNPASIFEKLLDQKTFICLRLGICNTILRETNRIRFGKAGAHPQLALGIAIAPETLFRNYNLLIFKGNCDFFRFALRFLFYFMIQFRFAPQMWAARPRLASIFEKLLDQKTFILPAAFDT